MIPVLLVGAALSLRVLHADDGRGWMIPGRVIVGLSEGRAKPKQPSEPADWKADVSESSWEFIIIHHSATESGSVDSIDQEHRRRKDSVGNPWLGIGYHFVIGNGNGMTDGVVEPTFRWNEQIHGAHSGNAVFNSRGIGICLIGDFEKTSPTNAQLKSVRELVKVLASRHRITRENLMGHASVKATACPGKHFPLKELRTVIPEFRS